MVKPGVRCALCDKGTLRRARIREQMFGVDLGLYHGYRCSNCGETYLDERQMDVLEERAKAAGVWGLGKKLKIVKSGNSLVLRIPADLAKFMHLKVGKEVFVRPEGQDCLVVEIEG